MLRYPIHQVECSPDEYTNLPETVWELPKAGCFFGLVSILIDVYERRRRRCGRYPIELHSYSDDSLEGLHAHYNAVLPPLDVDFIWECDYAESISFQLGLYDYILVSVPGVDLVEEVRFYMVIYIG